VYPPRLLVIALDIFHPRFRPARRLTVQPGRSRSPHIYSVSPAGFYHHGAKQMVRDGLKPKWPG
jgi:hypothetical protein